MTMMNALHLLWIIPLSVVFGVFMMALCVAAGKEVTMDETIYEDGKQWSGLLEEE